jgi:hypothetical protein
MSRPEKIELNTPTAHADAMGEMLAGELAKGANLQRVDKDGKTTFSFYPTKSEYFIISLKFHALCEDLGAKRKPEPEYNNEGYTNQPDIEEMSRSDADPGL